MYLFCLACKVFGSRWGRMSRSQVSSVWFWCVLVQAPFRHLSSPASVLRLWQTQLSAANWEVMTDKPGPIYCSLKTTRSLSPPRPGWAPMSERCFHPALCASVAWCLLTGHWNNPMGKMNELNSRHSLKNLFTGLAAYLALCPWFQSYFLFWKEFTASESQQPSLSVWFPVMLKSKKNIFLKLKISLHTWEATHHEIVYYAYNT